MKELAELRHAGLDAHGWLVLAVGLGVPRSTGVPEPHRMTIYDARPVAAQLSLDSEGLALFEHKSAMRDFMTRTNCAASTIPKPSVLSPK